MTAIQDAMSFEEVQYILLNHEVCLEHQHKVCMNEVSTAIANLAIENSHGGRRGLTATNQLAGLSFQFRRFPQFAHVRSRGCFGRECQHHMCQVCTCIIIITNLISIQKNVYSWAIVTNITNTCV